MTLFDEIREASAEVMASARSVRFDEVALERLAEALAAERPENPTLDPAHQPFADPAHTIAFVVTLNALNFGSGWFPVLRKSGGLSGYRTIATRLRERFERSGPLRAEALQQTSSGGCADLFGQRGNDAAAELMELFARSLRDLGAFLEAGWSGDFSGPVREAAGSAERLVRLLARMPLYRDVSRYDGREVPFYKRAQITCSDLALAFEGRGPGAFEDLASLTCFADNLVPHVLHRSGVLVYVPELRARIDAGELLEPGSPEEVEIRAGAVWAVERLAEECARRGFAVAPHRLDHLLWTRGQSPDIKAVARHRTRCPYY